MTSARRCDGALIRARHVRRASVWPCLVAAIVLACHGPKIEQPAPASTPYKSHIITAEEIEKSGAEDAWEVLRRLATTVRLEESYDGVPLRIHPRRGHGSILLQDDPMVYLDGVPLTDVRALRQIVAGDIDTVTELGGIEATAHYGTNSNAGVILIATKLRSEH